MSYSYEKIFSKANTAVNIVLDEMLSKPNREPLYTDEIKKIIEDRFKVDIEIKSTSFKHFERPACDAGAFMCRKNKNKFVILVNTDKPTAFQRFSIIHEMGHIATGCLINDKQNAWIISTNISYGIPSIPPKDKNQAYEVMANIFALKVIIPMDMLLEQIKAGKGIKYIALHFITDADAVLARIKLGDIL